MGSQIIRPVVPYRGHIPNGLQVDSAAEIRGYVPYGADSFQINLVAGWDSASDDRPLHISVRFNGRVVVRNTLQYNSWGHEERYGAFPFQNGQTFLMRISVKPDKYEIAVNNQVYWEYRHRIPFHRVSSLHIDGSVEIQQIDFIDRSIRPFTGNMPYPYPEPQTQPLPPVYNPIIPYAYPIYGGLKPNMMIYIDGKPFSGPYRFTINLQAGAGTPMDDIAFHFDVRFYNSSIVRNSRRQGAWDREETVCSHFPFSPGLSFDMMIRVDKKRFMVAVNGQHFIEFKHRLHPLSRFNTLFIERDVTISSIRFA